jgi:hypothetical protein
MARGGLGATGGINNRSAIFLHFFKRTPSLGIFLGVVSRGFELRPGVLMARKIVLAATEARPTRKI